MKHSVITWKRLMQIVLHKIARWFTKSHEIALSEWCDLRALEREKIEMRLEDLIVRPGVTQEQIHAIADALDVMHDDARLDMKLFKKLFHMPDVLWGPAASAVLPDYWVAP